MKFTMQPGLFAIAIATMLLAISPIYGQDRFTNLGPQITAATVQGTTFTRDPHGREVVCTVIRGLPAKLLVFDLQDGKLLHRLPLGDSRGAWNTTTATDGSVYVGTDNTGHLYRWIPGESEVKDLGQVAPDQSFVWDVAAGADGEIFLGTYPGCMVLRYHPDDGFRDVANGPAAPGEDYAYNLAVDAAKRRVYVGIGAHAKLIELDLNTGQKRDILPATYAGREFTHTVSFVAGKLAVIVTKPAEGFVLDPATGEVEAVLPDVQPHMFISAKAPGEDKFYFASDMKLASYDLKTRKTEVFPLDQPVTILGYHWRGDGKLALFTHSGRIITFDPATRKSSTVAVQIPPEPTPIQSLCLGPDGRVWAGGYLSGGVTAYDPATGQREQRRISQPEGMSTLGSRIYFGIYPRARLTWVETIGTADVEKGHRKEFDSLVGQDRPVGVLGVEKLNKVFYGTVPDYGKLGGVLAVVDAATDEVEVHHNIIPDQSIVSFVFANDLLVGGTSVSGGLGIEPTAKEAKLFIWDPAAKKVTFETVPVPGGKIVSGLVVGPDSNIWGFSDGALFVFDPAAKKVLWSKQLFDVDPNSRHAGWRDAIMALHPSGQIYGTVSGRLFQLDPATREVTVLRQGKIALLALDREGKVYFRQDICDLWQYTP